MIPTHKPFTIGAVETGARGEPGKSAYEIWKEQGNEGTIEDFLKSLKYDDTHVINRICALEQKINSILRERSL